MRDKIKRIANHYGFEKQSRNLTEECGELIQAVNKYYRYNEGLITRDDILTSTNDVNMLIQNIVEEVADVEIMLEQIKHLLHINPAAIEEIKVNKVNRQLERIKREVK
jgi:NTP pyrophosphatase (non-canonical NTP hydrolase)